jgi:hypothetical protein
MKILRQLCVALVFTFALTISALGGTIETPPAPPPPGEIQNGAAGEIQTPPCAPGEIQTPPCADTNTNSATQAALNLLQDLLGLL